MTEKVTSPALRKLQMWGPCLEEKFVEPTHMQDQNERPNDVPSLPCYVQFL